MLSDSVYERLILEVVLRYGSCGVLLRKNGSLGELRHQEFIAVLVVDWACYNSVSVKGVAHGEDYGLELCGETCSEV